MPRNTALQNKNPPAKKSFPLIPVLVGLLALGILAVAGGLGYAASMETNNAFCASCHTQPETTNYERFTAAAPVDLASFHHGEDTLCIACHSGPGVAGRVKAEFEGARNALAFYTGTAVQPGKIRGRFADANCLKCHQETVTQQRGSEGEEGHWHVFLARWQQQDGKAAVCADCHAGHFSGTSANAFMDVPTARAACDACHQALGRD